MHIRWGGEGGGGAEVQWDLAVDHGKRSNISSEGFVTEDGSRHVSRTGLGVLLGVLRVRLGWG